MTNALVKRVRVIPGAVLFGPCPYCTERHAPSYSYWFGVYAYLAGWKR